MKDEKVMTRKQTREEIDQAMMRVGLKIRTKEKEIEETRTTLKKLIESYRGMRLIETVGGTIQ